MIIKVCQHLAEGNPMLKSSKLKDDLELHQKELTRILTKPFEPNFMQHIIVEDEVEDLI
jgi:hypothetical protein|tara:strand:+ start:228 stop:404 length:177 start_codon:yes stop_codon:yes gene_type:complete